MIRVITLFSGYDSQCLALKRLGVAYELAAWCEIDKHACKAHDALFPQWAGRNVGDISKVDWAAWHREHPGEIDLLTYSSPCQDFSSAGLQRGGEEGSGTRSGLLWEVEKAIAALRPKALVFENVAALVSEKFIGVFNAWQVRLHGYGYTNFQQLMNAKGYGVPQNRLRIFMVSILDCHRAYYFPQPFKLERRLKDVLEQNVAERYYLKEEQVEKLMAATQSNEPQDNAMLGWTRSNTGKGDPTYHPVSVANCVTAAKRDNTQNYIVQPTIAAMRGRDKDNPNDRGKSTDNYAQRLELKPDGTSNTLTSVAKDNLLIEPTIIEDFYGTVRVPRLYTDEAPTLRADRTGIMTTEGIRIRRLTERELFRLMDVDEGDIDILLSAGIAKTQLAKMAGNSIVVACLYGIFRNLLVETEPQAGTQTELF